VFAHERTSPFNRASVRGLYRTAGTSYRDDAIAHSGAGASHCSPLPAVDGEGLLGSHEMEGVASEAWTNRQVQRHAEDSVSDLLSIWETNAPVFARILPNIPQPVISQFMFDQTTHEHDIRRAVSKPGARDTLAVAVAEGFIRNSLAQQSDPAIAQLANHKLTGFEYLRSLSGRRSGAQISKNGFDTETVEAFIRTMPFDIPESDVSDD